MFYNYNMKANSYLKEDFFVVYPLFVCFDSNGLVPRPRPLEICTVVNSQYLLKEVILLTVCNS